mgnify:CR=1 FL=1
MNLVKISLIQIGVGKSRRADNDLIDGVQITQAFDLDSDISYLSVLDRVNVISNFILVGTVAVLVVGDHTSIFIFKECVRLNR